MVSKTRMFRYTHNTGFLVAFKDMTLIFLNLSFITSSKNWKLKSFIKSFSIDSALHKCDHKIQYNTIENAT